MAPKYKRALTVDEYTTEKYDVILNKLLGDYNANGVYVINKKVSAELLELKKAKKDSYNNEIFCTAKTSSGRIIDFDISFKKNSQSKMAVAELSVLEGVPKQGGRMMNVLKTPIAKFTQEITPNFVDLALAKFNVVLEIVDEGQEIKEVDDAYITKRNMLLGYLDKLTSDNYNIIYEDYFTQRINLLKSMNNAYSKKILAIFNEEFNKMSDFFLVDKKNKKVTNFKAMNELLDKAFEDISGLEQYAENEKMYKERILPILSMFIQGAERIESSAMKSVLDTVPKRLKDALTETLIDKKQTSESRIEPTVKETSKETLQRELDSSVESMKSKLDRLAGRTMGSTTPTATTRKPRTADDEHVLTEPVKGATPVAGPGKAVSDGLKPVVTAIEPVLGDEYESSGKGVTGKGPIIAGSSELEFSMDGEHPVMAGVKKLINKGIAAGEHLSKVKRGLEEFIEIETGRGVKTEKPFTGKFDLDVDGLDDDYTPGGEIESEVPDVEAIKVDASATHVKKEVNKGQEIIR